MLIVLMVMSSAAVMAGDFCQKHEFSHYDIEEGAEIFSSGDYDEYRAGFTYSGSSEDSSLEFRFDSCMDETTIYEKYCDGDIPGTIAIDCPGGCVTTDGGVAVCEFATYEEEVEQREAWEVTRPKKTCSDGIDNDFSGTIDYDNGNGGWCDVDRDGIVGEKSAYSFAKGMFVDENNISKIRCESDFLYMGVVDEDVSFGAAKEPGFFGRIFGRFFVDVTGYAVNENVRALGVGSNEPALSGDSDAEDVAEDDTVVFGAAEVNTGVSLFTCTDSDGGKDYYTKGIGSGTTFAGGVLNDVEDSCDGSQVIEKYCSSADILSTIYKDCTFGCSDGACVDATFDLETGDLLTDKEAGSAIPETTVALADVDFDASCTQGEAREGYTCVCTWVEDEEVDGFEIDQQVAFEAELLDRVESGDFTRPDIEFGGSDDSDGIDFERSKSAKWYVFDHDCTSRSADEYGFADMDTALESGVVVEDDDGDVLGTATIEVYTPSEQSYVEMPECSDGVDNDGDTKIDYESPMLGQERDGGCDSIYDDTEAHMAIASNPFDEEEESDGQDRVAALDSDGAELELHDDQVDEVGFIGKLFGRG